VPRQKYGKPDSNQQEIVDALREAGYSVAPLTSAGDGVPDLLIGIDGCNILIEVKDGNKPPSAQKLNPKQVEWHNEWQGQCAVANSVESALEIITLYKQHEQR
jgi:Holliday junction resolvase